MSESANKVARRQVDNWFTEHIPTIDQGMHMRAVREAAKGFAHEILDNVPSCADRTAALRLLRECVMTANAAIVLPPVHAQAVKVTADAVVTPANEEPENVLFYSDPNQQGMLWRDKTKPKDC